MRSNWPSLLGFLFILIFAQACGPAKEQPEKDPVPPSSMFVEATGHFCDANSSDKFTLGYFGAHPLDTTMYFYIVCHQNDTIYKDQWPSQWMYEPEERVNDSLAIAKLHQNMRAFVEGKMHFEPDSSAANPPSGQLEFNYDLNGHVQKRLYFSKANRKAVEI